MQQNLSRIVWRAIRPGVDSSIALFITDFADQAVILPVFVAVTIVLLVQRRRRLAGVWVGTIVGVLGAMLLLKLGFQACSWLSPTLSANGWDLNNPSGHTASSSAVFGALAALLLHRDRQRSVRSGVCVAVATALVIGTTRVVLHDHTVADVVAGAVIGIIGATVFAALTRQSDSVAEPRRMGRIYPLVLAALAMMAIFHGTRLAAEPTIHGAAIILVRHYVPVCQPDTIGVTKRPGL